MLRHLLAMAALFLPLAAAAQEDGGRFDIASDSYMAGGGVVFSGPEGTDDLYMIGEDVELAAPIAGSAHLAGRRLSVLQPVGGALYAAGFDVDVTGSIGGDASVFGYGIAIRGAIAGDLRAAGSEVKLSAPVAGYALVTGERVELAATVGDDLVVAARKVDFRSGAQVGGNLTLYVPDPAQVSVPESVAPAGRVTILPAEAFERGEFPGYRGPVISAWQVMGGFLFGVLVTGLFAAIVAAAAPARVRSWRDLAAARPGRALVSGFLVASMLSGSLIVLVFTLVGVLLVPFIFVLTWLVLFCGYALGAYLVGTLVWRAAGRDLPTAFPGLFGVAVLGAFLTALAWIVPVLGWFFVMGLTLVGVGVLAAHLLPRNLLLHAQGGGGAATG